MVIFWMLLRNLLLLCFSCSSILVKSLMMFISFLLLILYIIISFYYYNFCALFNKFLPILGVWRCSMVSFRAVFKAFALNECQNWEFINIQVSRFIRTNIMVNWEIFLMLYILWQTLPYTICCPLLCQWSQLVYFEFLHLCPYLKLIVNSYSWILLSRLCYQDYAYFIIFFFSTVLISRKYGIELSILKYLAEFD